jgi:hypothetical protein
MVASGIVKRREPSNPPTREELIRRVNVTTCRQVENLDIVCEGALIRVRGRSRTYYVKQLVTQAILSSLPSAQLENDVLVQAS